MDKEESVRVIKAAGGPAAFAKLVGIDGKKSYPQIINNWLNRGIPAQVVLDHLDVIRKLQRTAAAAEPIPVSRQPSAARART